MAKPETASSRTRIFPSTYERLRKRVRGGKAGTLFAEVVDDIERKATLYEKLSKDKRKEK